MCNSRLKTIIDNSSDPNFYYSEYNKALLEIKRLGLRHNSMMKYFEIFIENEVKDNLVDRCVRLRKLGSKTTLERKQLQYGEELGREKWNAYCDRQAHTNTLDYKREKYGMNDQDFRRYNSNRASTLENFIKRHGEELGREKWNAYCKRQSYAGCSKEYFIDFYGEDAGILEYNRVNSLKTRTLDNFIRQYGDVEGNVRYLQYMTSNNQRFSTGSKISQKIFWELFDTLSDSEKETCYFMEHKGEFGKYCKTTQKYRYFDFVITCLKLCIEFNGDVFHANPDKYSENDRPNFFAKNLTSKEIWENDRQKNLLLTSCGYKVVVAWESTYNIDLLKREIEYAREGIRMDS